MPVTTTSNHVFTSLSFSQLLFFVLRLSSSTHLISIYLSMHSFNYLNMFLYFFFFIPSLIPYLFVLKSQSTTPHILQTQFILISQLLFDPSSSRSQSHHITFFYLLLSVGRELRLEERACALPPRLSLRGMETGRECPCLQCRCKGF